MLGCNDEEEVYILRTPTKTVKHDKKARKPVILLLIKDKYENKHYCLVKNLSRLLSSQVSKGNRKRHFCNYCLNHFHSEISLMKHTKKCLKR